MKDGYIKFNCNWIKSKLDFDIEEINYWRYKLFKLKLIGSYPDGIGYGNISIKTQKGFLITGSTTGNIKELTKEHYTEVIDYDIPKNSLTCKGPIKASSESLSHAVVYESNHEIKAVIHIHDLDLWNHLIYKVPTTSEKAEYGSPEMAYEIKRILDIKNKIIVMAGHEEGVITFGKNLEEAGNILLSYQKKL